MALTKKKAQEIRYRLGKIFELKDLKEFDIENSMFELPPENWTEKAKAVCDYQARKQMEILSMLRAVLETPSLATWEDTENKGEPEEDEKS